MKRCVAILLCVAGGLSAQARVWTRPDGKTVEAEVLKVNPNRTVVLKTPRGKTFTVPFSTFAEADVEHLEALRAQGGAAAAPHSTTWDEMNKLFGLSIWSDDNLWDDPTAEAAGRIGLREESKTAYMENHRAYPLGQANVLNQPVYALALYGGRERVDSLAFIFLNLGDIPAGTDPKKVGGLIELAGDGIRQRIEGALGEPRRDSLGHGDLREKVWRWDWNGHAVMLSVQDEKYVAMRIMPTARADQGGRVAKVSDAELRQRMASCVERRANGDVIINNIPMINQGPKGYCSPATWERYLRYAEIPADMYLLALAANTGVGGGTYSQDMIDATGNIISTYGRKLGSAGTTPKIGKIRKYIDQGLPVMWSFMSTPAFQLETTLNTARRNGREIHIAQNNSGQSEDAGSGGHICLIIGYNEQTGEIAISDSWGPKFAERWAREESMKKLSYGAMKVIKW